MQLFQFGAAIKEMSFKDFFYQMGNFGRGLQEEYLCEITLD